MTLNALGAIIRVVGTCGPRQRSPQTRLAGAQVDVVVDGQLGAADLHDVRAALAADQAALVGLVGELDARVGLGHHPADEALAGLDDLDHALLDAGQVLGIERLGDVELVVEAVLDRRADAELRLGEDVLDRLGHHVRARVAQDAQPVGVGDHDGLDGGDRRAPAGRGRPARRRRGRPPRPRSPGTTSPRTSAHVVRGVDVPDLRLPGDDDCDLRGHGTPRCDPGHGRGLVCRGPAYPVGRRAAAWPPDRSHSGPGHGTVMDGRATAGGGADVQR